MRNSLQDIRYALRALRKRPVISLLSILCLGVGIGASAAIFSPVDVFMLRPLPYPQSGELLATYLTYPPRGWTDLNFSLADFRDHRAMSRTLDIAAWDSWGYNLSGGDVPERIFGQQVSYNFLRVLRTPPTEGRAFLPEDEQPGAPHVAILSHELWVNRFGGAAVIDTVIKLDGESYTVVGIMPEHFMPPNPGAQIYTPLMMPAAPSRSWYSLDLVARLRPGVTQQAANEDVERVAAQLAQQYPDDNKDVGARVGPLWNAMFGRQFRDGSLICSAAVILLLLIACANVANLLLAQAADRGREIAVRTALGAARGRIVTQLLTESVVLGLAGGVVGVPLGWAGIKGLSSLFPSGMPRVQEIAMDWRVLGFAVLVTLVVGVVAGIVPALQASKQDLREALQEGGRGAPVSRRSGRLRNSFVTAQVAFALVLLVASGLLVKGFLRVKDARLGIETASVLTFRTTPPETKFADNAALRRFARELEERMRALPGVTAAGLTSNLPFSGNSNTSYHLEGEEPDQGLRLTVSFRSVSAGYFDALGMTLRRGRGFRAADDSGSTPVMVVNEAFVRRHWPDGDALGQRVVFGSDPKEIVGVVGDTREFAYEDPSPPAMVFLPAAQSPFRVMGVALRTAGDPLALVAAARRAVTQLDPDQPIYDVLTLDRLHAEDVQADGIMARIMMALAGVALVLSLVGVYGVMAYSVSQRVHEIGVRMALGAGRRAVVGLVVRQGAKVAAIGCAIGLLLALGVSRGLAAFLYGVSAFDPVTFGTVVLALGLAAIVASWLPARRASRVDPIVALRGE